MDGRTDIEQLLRCLYDARMRGALEEVCRLFSPAAHFSVAGNSGGKPIAIKEDGEEGIRAWLALMVKTFKLTDFENVSMVIDPPRAAVYWRANILSRVTGISVRTDLVDMVEIREGRIVSYIEFFVPR